MDGAGIRVVDARNRLLWANDPLYRNSDGYTVSFSCDLAGNKLSERRANNQLITFDSYDQMNRLAQQTERRDGNAVNNLVTKWSWYSSGALHTMTDPRGKVYTYGFDLMNRQDQPFVSSRRRRRGAPGEL